MPRRGLFKKKKKRPQDKTRPQVPDRVVEKSNGSPVNEKLEKNLKFFQDLLGGNDDFRVRRFHVFGHTPAALLNFTKISDNSVVNDKLLKSLMVADRQTERDQQESIIDVLLNDTLYYEACEREQDRAKLIEAVMRGETVLLIDGEKEAVHFDTRHVKQRGVTEPETEQVVRGAREGFIESLGVNLGMLRYRLPTTDFRVKTMEIGRLTKSKVAICYLDGIANPDLIKEVRDRLEAIDIQGILDSGYLEQFIEDHHITPFPQVLNTERPDTTVGNIMEGRVAILVDGSPFALIVPAVFNEFYQTVEDYNTRFGIASLIRFIRLLAIIFSLIFPSLYVSLVTYNPELIPTEFAVAIAGGRGGVPFPPVIEILVMEIAMEVLREATLRLPKQVGGALSIVGVLIIGESAVSAGLANPITVVVVALTTIGSFAAPAYSAAVALRMLRFPLVIAAGLFGLYGLMFGLILIMNHVLSLRSFGVPYAAPIAPGYWQGMKDSVIRAPLWRMAFRPAQLHPRNDTRLAKRSVNALKRPPSNTLNPLKVGNERWHDDSDGISPRNDQNPDDRDSP